MIKNYRNCERGHILVGVLMILAISLILAAGMLQSASSTQSTRRVVDANTKNFYEVERAINAATAWLQSNSKNIVTAFSAANFSNNFDLGNPAAGDNEGTSFAVPTLIKMKGRGSAVQLTNSSYFGTSAFPATANIDTGASFNAISSFQAQDFGAGVNVRLLAVWATETAGNYQPIFRVDAVTGGDAPEHGVHGINFIRSSLVTSNSAVGYYADIGDFQTANSNNSCYSYVYSWNAASNSWSRGAPRSNCMISGADQITLSSAIYGNVSTKTDKGISLKRGSISGAKCEGASCVSYTLPTQIPWSTRCAGVTRDVTAGTSTDLASGPRLAEQCYRDVTVNANRQINFVTANQPYYIRNLILRNNSNSKVTFKTAGPGNKYTLYADNFANGSINGNQLISTNLAPHQLEVNLTQDATLTLNGTAAMNGVFIANNNSSIVDLGNFLFSGALRANQVSVTGNATLGYDEGLGGPPTLSDMNFTLYKASQRYR